MIPGWHAASKREPCPICGHTSWCLIADNHETIICYRKQGDHPTKSGNGWIYHSNGWSPTPHIIRTEEQRPEENDGSAARRHFERLPNSGDIHQRMITALGKQLGLPADCLEALDVRWDMQHRACAFPMRNGKGVICGVRFRDFTTGRKWALKGSRDGLFIPSGVLWEEEVVVLEGPTDTAAAHALGLPALGRSSCGTGRDAIKEWIKDHGARCLTIVADNDPPKMFQGRAWYPGFDGAKRLAEQIGMKTRIVFPPPGIKDMRQWYNNGELTLKAFEKSANYANWTIYGTPREITI